MRLLSAVLIIALFSYIGYSKAWSMKLRERLLIGFAKDLNCICDELTARPRDIIHILQKLCDGERGEFWRLFSQGISSSQKAEDAWNSAVANFSYASVLEEEEKSLLREAGIGIGAKGMQLQVRYMEASAKALAAQGREIKTEVSKKGGMYSRLGFLAGLATALIII